MHILSLITFLSNNILCTSLTNYRYKFSKHTFLLNSVSGSEDIDMSNRVYILFGYICIVLLGVVFFTFISAICVRLDSSARHF